jgi:hypothetical protein
MSGREAGLARLQIPPDAADRFGLVGEQVVLALVA